MYNNIVKFNKIIKFFIAAVIFFSLNPEPNYSLALERSAFDKEVEMTSKKIQKLGTEDYHFARSLAAQIQKESQKHSIRPEILLAILKVESSFNQEAISRTGDISMAQINFKIWDKEFKRLKREKIDHNRLKTDSSYAIKVMAEILSIIKQQRKNDPHWYAAYHSKTKSYRLAYLKKIKKQLSIIERI